MNVRIHDTINVNFQSLSSPPDGSFIHGGESFRDVYSLAAGLCHELDVSADGSPFCVRTESKSLMLASLLASYFSGRPAVIPYSFSPQVIDEAREACRFTAIVTDGGATDAPGLPLIRPVRRDDLIASMAGRRTEPDRIFLYLFTGGTTGMPRVWSKTPRNIFAEAAFQTGLFGFSGDDVVMATVPPYHIYGLLFSVIVPLMSGASVMPGVYTFPQEICSRLMKGDATVLISVPMHYHVLEGYAVSGHRLRAAFSSAGSLDARDAMNFFSMTGVGVNEIYGSTETGGIAWKCRARGDDFLRPFDSVSWKISGDRLAVRSDFLSPDLSFDSEGFFVTGDRAAAREDGTIQLLGRSDGVVKIAGKRVDLGEVQVKIKNIPGVSDVYCFSMKGRAGRGSEIVALIEGSLDEAEVRRLAAAVLEPYAVPRRIKIVGSIPLTETGKYDRGAIEAVFSSGKKRGVQ